MAVSQQASWPDVFDFGLPMCLPACMAAEPPYHVLVLWTELVLH